MMLKVDHHSKGNKALSVVGIILMLLSITIYADETVDNVDSKSNINNEISASSMYPQKFKRAWNQLQSGGWGKRNYDEINDDDSDQWNRRLLKFYAEQLLGNKQLYGDMDDEDNGVDKRAWSQFNNGWGKRDWNQLRGNAWGKRREWNKLSSVWGKK